MPSPTNPPTQGREEAVERAAKVLDARVNPGREGYQACLAFHRESARLALNAAYPEQTEGDEREWTLKRALSGGIAVQGPLPQSGEILSVVECSRLIAAEQERDKLGDERAQLIVSVHTAKQRAEKAERERDAARRAIGHGLTEIAMYRRIAERAESPAEADRDRLQRECEKLRKALREIAALRQDPRGHLPKSPGLIATLALDALEKPNDEAAKHDAEMIASEALEEVEGGPMP